MTLQEIIGPGIALLISIIGGALAYGKLVGRVNEVATKVAEMNAVQTAIRQRGPGRYVSAEECSIEHNECRLEVCKKIDTIFAVIAQGEKKRDEARTEFVKSMEQVNRFIGRVDEYMRQQEKILNGRQK